MAPPLLGAGVAICVLGIALLLFVRVWRLDADPPRWLTWSGAADTDEGFYTLDARYRALFGADALGDFHDRALAPLLSWGQQAWYGLFGASVNSARSLDALCGLLCVGVLAWGLHRTAGRRAAGWGLLLLGLCPTFVYYNRLALQETSAALLLTLAWALWSLPNRAGRGTAFAAGAVLVLACAVKVLCVVFLPVALVLAVTGKEPTPVPSRSGRGVGEVLSVTLPASGRDGEGLSFPDGVIGEGFFSRRGLLFGLGAMATAALLTAVWIWPERHALLTTAAYYSDAQAGAGGAAHLLWNVRRAMVGDAMGVRRGLVPYALCFWPALAVLAGLSLRRPGRDPFLVAWAACGVLYCLLSSYAPDRYYVLFLPALAGMAAREAVKQHRNVQVLVMGVALGVSGFWLGAGLMHPRYARAQASQVLARALPPGATVVGDAAPALCMGTRLRAAPVQFGLSNSVDPGAQTGARYIVTGREPLWTRFWARTEPGACVPERRLLTVRLASGRVVDVYRTRREPERKWDGLQKRGQGKATPFPAPLGFPLKGEDRE